MPRIEAFTARGADVEEFLFQCPGCKGGHWFRVKGPRPLWTWNQDFEKPTISPSILVNRDDPASRCHSFVEAGMIRFLDDCFHELKGQTVPLPELD